MSLLSEAIQHLSEKQIKRNKGAVLTPIKGLYNAKPGDIIEVGFEGSRQKYVTKIDKIVSNDRLQDRDGNLFGRDGMVYRRKSGWMWDTKGKIVFARHMTQTQLDDDLRKRKIEYLKSARWNEMSDDKLNDVLALMRVSFSTMQGSTEENQNEY